MDNDNDIDIETSSNLDGITVGGEHLISWLKHKHTDEKTREIQQTRQEQVTIHHGKHRPWREKEKETGPKVSKRVRRLTNKEIRKEYGIMAKPYESIPENIIWCIVEKGPVNNNEMMEIVEYEKNITSFSSIVTSVWRRTGDEGAQLIERKKMPGTVYYEYRKKPGVELSTDAIIEQYKLWGKKEYRENQLAIRRNAFLDSLTEQERIELLEKEKLEKEEATNQKETQSQNEKKSTVDTIQKTITSKANQSLDININISGHIKFLFGIDG